MTISRQCQYCLFSMAEGQFQCRACGRWNMGDANSESASREGEGSILLSDARILDMARARTGPWDTVFGGGLVLTSTNLLAGEPGAGKSTLGLQIAQQRIEDTGRDLFYIATEESNAQVRDRAVRIGITNLDKIRVASFRDGYRLNPLAEIEARKPCAVIVDSLPGLARRDHALSVQYCESFKVLAVNLECPFLIFNHINKEGDFAGMMGLQHEVDGTFMIYVRDKGKPSRRMVTIKNRFGANTQVCMNMTKHGLIVCSGCLKCKEEREDNERLGRGDLSS